VPGLSLGALRSANYRFIACFSDRDRAASAAGIRSVDFITWRRRGYRLCTLWERPTQFPCRSSKTQFGYKFISLRPCDDTRQGWGAGEGGGRGKCRQADLLISATLRRPWSLRGATVAARVLVDNFIFLLQTVYIVADKCSYFYLEPAAADEAGLLFWVRRCCNDDCLQHYTELENRPTPTRPKGSRTMPLLLL